MVIRAEARKGTQLVARRPASKNLRQQRKGHRVGETPRQLIINHLKRPEDAHRMHADNQARFHNMRSSEPTAPSSFLAHESAHTPGTLRLQRA
jgi:hypothetical protein